ncbi:MAG: peptidoglycan DD-metalloendopeptidase family protein [Acidobacteriota bacterium]
MRLVTFAIIGAAAMGAAGPTVRVDARAFQPGEVMSVTIDAVDPGQEPRVTAFDRRAPVFELSATRWRALVGIDLDVKPGPHDIAIETGPPDHPLRTVRSVIIARKVFQTRRLTVAEAFVNPPPEVQARIETEAARLGQLFGAASTRRLWRGPFARPVSDPANSAFGSRSILNGQPRSPHGGTDFLSEAGTPVQAPNAGHVVLAEDLYYTGNTVVIDHGQGLVSLFAHLSAVNVETGRDVKTGDVIGLVGATGRVTGPHLHWTVRLGTARVDPLSLVAIAQDDPGVPAVNRPAPAPRPRAGAVP